MTIQSISNVHNKKVLVDLYDILFTANEEKEFILKLIGEGNENGIEAGCGTCRLTIPLSEMGWEMSAFDNDFEILQIAENKVKDLPNININILKGDMKLQWPTNSNMLALICYNTFLLCNSYKEQMEILRNAYNSLNLGGRLLISIKYPVDFSNTVIKEPVIHDNKYYFMSIYRFKNETNKFKTYYNIKIIDEQGLTQNYISYWCGCYIGFNKLIKAAKKIGFKNGDFYGGYNFESFTEKGNIFIGSFYK